MLEVKQLCLAVYHLSDWTPKPCGITILYVQKSNDFEVAPPVPLQVWSYTSSYLIITDAYLSTETCIYGTLSFTVVSHLLIKL